MGADFIRGATLSPDRQRLAFESWTIRQRIVRAAVGAATSTDVSVSSRIDRVPKLSPDGHCLAFVSTRDGFANVWLNEGGAERQLTHFRPEDPEFLSWHPSEPWLAFSITRADGSFACMVDTAVAEPELRCGARAGRAAPFWSPDGRTFRFAAPDAQGYSVFEIDSVLSAATPVRVIADAYFATRSRVIFACSRAAASSSCTRDRSSRCSRLSSTNCGGAPVAHKMKMNPNFA